MEFIFFDIYYKDQVFPSLVPEKYYKRYTNSSLFYKVLFVMGVFRNYLFLLKDADDRVVGSIAFRRKFIVNQLKNKWFIYGVAIKEKHRGKGYGDLLLSEALAWCKKKSIKNVFLHVEAENTKAINLYKKKGFMVVQPDKKNINKKMPVSNISMQKKFT